MGLVNYNGTIFEELTVILDISLSEQNRTRGYCVLWSPILSYFFYLMAIDRSGMIVSDIIEDYYEFDLIIE